MTMAVAVTVTVTVTMAVTVTMCMADGACCTKGRRPRATAGWTNAVGANLSLEACAGGGKRIARDVLVDVDGLRMLTQVIEARESSGAVALKGTFSCMFSGCEEVSKMAMQSQAKGRQSPDIHAERIMRGKVSK